ncbi:hypothetical protein [Streptomyces sp. NPDC006267]|uniref:NucA/NucB deoxyribonuclease domain-containing protein n=1 Tax=Streptomyces sp. NPDC006267 TaxID=3157173 RepID=UPI0033AF4E29
MQHSNCAAAPVIPDRPTASAKDCDENAPGAPAAGRDCDEYPFRSTAQGAARQLYEGDEYESDFSVRYVDPAENREAGNRLGAWCQTGRILDWEPSPSPSATDIPPT